MDPWTCEQYGDWQGQSISSLQEKVVYHYLSAGSTDCIYMICTTTLWYIPRPGDDVVPEEVREFQVTVLVATLTGFLLGGMVGARYAGDKFVSISHSAKFSSTMQAQVYNM